MKNVGGKVRALRLEKQITLPDLAELAHLSKGLISKIENAEDANPSLDTLYKISEALDVPLSALLETERVQMKRIVPDRPPEWQREVLRWLKTSGKEPDENILNAMYVVNNRKGAKAVDLDTWKFLYQSIEKSFKP
jgi:transcriptional regulator with XRE-family HTH domain